MALVTEQDFGTPARISPSMVTLEIDGEAVTVPAGTSVMRAAAEIETAIPKLCATDSLEPFGSCRLCVVEIEGRRGTPASCTTPVEPGMKVRTQTPKLAKLRRNVMELYISDHPLDCLTCAANGDCELQDMAGVVGLREVRYGYDGANHLVGEKDTSNPYFTFDPTKCIVCSRCVRACEEVQGTFALTIDGRGFGSFVSAGQDDGFKESECVSCGACVQACPTATLDGEQHHRGRPAGAFGGHHLRLLRRRLRLQGRDAGHRGGADDAVQGRQGQSRPQLRQGPLRLGLRHPQGPDHQADDPQADHRPVARGVVGGGDQLCRLRAEADPGHLRPAISIGGITSSRCTNEETYLVQKMIRAGFGNNNVDTCARVCHSPTGYGLGQTFGTSAGTQDFDSVDETDVMVVIGANPTDAHPVFGSRMKRRLREGARLIVVDPRRIDLVKSAHIKADHHLQLKPGTNVAVVNALAHVIVTEGLVAEDYVRERCDLAEFSRWAEFIADPRHAPEAVEEITGVPAAEVRAAARLYATGGRAAIYYGLGVTEHSQGSTMVMGMANLAMLTGNIGRRGVGVNPLRGQNNVQGSCDMGSFPHEFPGYRHVAGDEVRKIYEEMWGVSLSAEPGLRIPNMLDAAVDGGFKGLYVQGEDIAQSDPDVKHVTAGLAAMECVIVQDLFLNETASYAHVFLPGSSFLEKDGTFTNAERRISRVRRVTPPKAGYADWEVTMLLSEALGYLDALQPIRARSWTRSPGPRRPSRTCRSSGWTSWARYSGRATTRRRKAPRSCISTTSCAARAGS